MRVINSGIEAGRKGHHRWQHRTFNEALYSFPSLSLARGFLRRDAKRRLLCFLGGGLPSFLSYFHSNHGNIIVQFFYKNFSSKFFV